MRRDEHKWVVAGASTTSLFRLLLCAALMPCGVGAQGTGARTLAMKMQPAVSGTIGFAEAVSGAVRDGWNARVMAGCTSGVEALLAKNQTNSLGVFVCYNVPAIENTTGLFAADLRLYMSAGAGQLPPMTTLNVSFASLATIRSTPPASGGLSINRGPNGGAMTLNKRSMSMSRGPDDGHVHADADADNYTNLRVVERHQRPHDLLTKRQATFAGAVPVTATGPPAAPIPPAAQAVASGVREVARFQFVAQADLRGTRARGIDDFLDGITPQVSVSVVSDAGMDERMSGRLITLDDDASAVRYVAGIAGRGQEPYEPVLTADGRRCPGRIFGGMDGSASPISAIAVGIWGILWVLMLGSGTVYRWNEERKKAKLGREK
ncbi:hypothetical protein PYCC9005_002278 [Savitreella phatthalungensis]